ncbi:MAG: dihydrofolate reductase family protein [Bacteroidota bacterium]|nr:dihydrofolate reductase family protein [Bacteroidota bacterium]
MGSVIFAVNITIDGVCDHTNVIADDELHEYFTELLRGVDIVVFGRKTYQLMYPYWHDIAVSQSETTATNEFARKFDSMERIVFSKTLNKVEWAKTRISREKPEDEISRLKQQSGKKISVGSLNIASHLARLGMIDEFHFVVHPIVAGAGRRLFENEKLKENLRLKLIETKTFRSGAVALHYKTMHNK